MKDELKSALIGAIGGLVAAIVTPLFAHWLDKSPTVASVDFAPQITHIGDEARPDYPDEQTGRKIAVSFARLLPRTPTAGVILFDAYDVDLIGAEVLFNGNVMGTVKTGEDWQENSFQVTRKQFLEAPNIIEVRSHKWPNNQAEDFLIKNLRMEMRYN